MREKRRSSGKVPGARGRPSSYRTEFAELAGRLALLGLTDAEIAGVLGTSEVTVNAWKKEQPAFAQALNDGKAVADSRVVESLYQRALGYSHKSVKIFNANGAPLVVPFLEHYPPDAVACIFWLKNRQPKLWRDKIDHAHSGRMDIAGLPGDVLQVMRKLARLRSSGKPNAKA